MHNSRTAPNRSGWKKSSLGDFFRIKHGYAFKGEFFSNLGEFVLLTPGNFQIDGGLKLKGEKETYYSGNFPQDFILNKGDLIVAMTDLKQSAPILGSAAVIPESGIFLHNQRLGKIIDLKEKELHKKFLYFLFNSFNVRSQIKGSATGTTVRHTAPERIYSVNIDLPPIRTQRKIASTLSVYDDLIENNTRRIKIIEEMAQAIYREWFVNFRYPGHEDVRMVESELGLVPEGWEIRKIGDIAEEVRRNVEPNMVHPDTPYFGLEHIPRKSIALSEWGVAKDVQSTKHQFFKGEILFGKIRPYFHKVGVAPVDGVCSSDAIVIRPKKPEYFGLVLFCVSSEDFVSQATQTSQGTKMPRANWNVLVNYPVVIPPKALLDEFNNIASGTVDLVITKIFQNANLRRTRDLLVPKLISGEIEVSGLDIEIPAA
ncbi:MAG: restriction endonuclease subunit S [Methanoregula sp.]|nr:restriction endonuclease subunit S [Methanoregula sp.]